MSRKRRYGRSITKRAAIVPNLKPLTRMKVPKGSTIVASPPGESMSAVLWEFIDPYRDNSLENTTKLDKLLTVALVAWNAAIVPSGKRDELIDNCLATLPPEIRADGRAVIETLIARKQAHFAANQRMILSYELTMRPTGPNLKVLSTPPADMRDS